MRGERFAQWLTAFGVSAIAKRIGVVRQTVQQWKSAGRYTSAPRLAQAWTIIALSHHYPHSIGPLTLDDIYGALPEIAPREQPQ